MVVEKLAKRDKWSVLNAFPKASTGNVGENPLVVLFVESWSLQNRELFPYFWELLPFFFKRLSV